MNDSGNENARAGKEARDAVVGRPRGSRTDAIGAALRRYLGAETYQEQRRRDEDAERVEKEPDVTQVKRSRKRS